MSKEEKDKLKKQKQIEKQKKAKQKLDERLAKIAEKKKQSGKVNVEKSTEADWSEPEESDEEETPKKDNWFTRFLDKHKLKKNLYDKKDLKRTEEKDKHNYKLAFKEFPVKMVKEVSKIKWADKKTLTYKFIQVVIFMVVSAAFFFFIDWIFKLIFTAIHVI